MNDHKYFHNVKVGPVALETKEFRAYFPSSFDFYLKPCIDLRDLDSSITDDEYREIGRQFCQEWSQARNNKLKEGN